MSDSPWKLYLGDCIEGMRELSDKSVDHFVTDPPYEMEAHTHRRKTPGWRGGNPPQSNPVPFAPITEVVRTQASREMGRLARRWALVFCQTEAAHLWRAEMEWFELLSKRTAIWVKPDGQPQLTGDRPGVGYESIVVAHSPGATRWNAGGKVGVYECVRNQNGVHPTQKPLALVEELIRDFTDPGDLVCDPFAGSGTTGVACIRLGRRFIGWEKDPTFHAAAMKRLSAARQQYWLPSRPAKPKQQGLGFTSREAPQAPEKESA